MSLSSIEIGVMIKKGRKKNCWAQHELAAKMGVHQTHVSHWEKGEKRISGRDLIKIAELLGIVQEFFPEKADTAQPGQAVSPRGSTFKKMESNFDQISKRIELLEAKVSGQTVVGSKSQEREISAEKDENTVTVKKREIILLNNGSDYATSVAIQDTICGPGTNVDFVVQGDEFNFFSHLNSTNALVPLVLINGRMTDSNSQNKLVAERTIKRLLDKESRWKEIPIIVFCQKRKLEIPSGRTILISLKGDLLDLGQLKKVVNQINFDWPLRLSS